MIEHILNKKPNDGLVDEYKDIRLRIGIVDNPTLTRKKDEKINPLNPIGAVNVNTGRICVRWIDEQGGLIRSDKYKGKQDYKSASVDGHGVVANVSNDTSNREMITLTHPMIWANNTNWCGMHYLPPVGSVVIVGFKRHGLPVLLGYVQSHYEICNPIKLGEIMMKGYGNNYLHWKQSSRLEAKVWAKAGDIDLDSTSFTKKNDSTININMKLDAHDKFIKFDISDVENGATTSMTMTPSNFSVSSGSINLNGSVSINGTSLQPGGDNF